MQLELINIGRNQVCEKVTLKKPITERKIFKAVKKHLLSKDITIMESDTKCLYNVYAGFRSVGQIKSEEPLF